MLLTKWTNVKDLTGQKINNLLVIKQNGRTKYRQVKWLCKCDCGRQTVVISNNLLNGNTESCGCRRKINQRKGLAWERLVKELLVYKYNKLQYHVYLPNKMIPDFMTADEKIILEAKRNDYLQIEECIKKYGPYCEKLIFICMEKKRIDWKSDFDYDNKIVFWYPNDIFDWLPQKKKNYFLNELKIIENMWVEINNNSRPEEMIQDTINLLEREGKNVTQINIGKKLGISNKIFKNSDNFKEIFQNYKKNSELLKNEELTSKVKEIVTHLFEINGRISFQNVARILIKGSSIKNYQNQLWNQTKLLSTNSKIKELINNKIKEQEQKRKEVILNAIKILKSQKEKVTIVDIRKYTKFSKNFLYTPEIKSYIEKKIQKYDNENDTLNKHYRYKITIQEVEDIIANLKAKRTTISMKEIQRQSHCDYKAIKKDQIIKNFIENEIKIQKENKKQLLIEAIEEIKTSGSNISMESIALKTGLSKKFIRKEENKILIQREILNSNEMKKQKVIEAVLHLKNNGKLVTNKSIRDYTGVSRKYLAKNEIKDIIESLKRRPLVNKANYF